MFVVETFLRHPKETEMTLSSQVKESVNAATNHLREALAFAARAEHPVTISSLTDILCRLDSLEHMDDLMQRFSQPKNTPTTFN